MDPPTSCLALSTTCRYIRSFRRVIFNGHGKCALRTSFNRRGSRLIGFPHCSHLFNEVTDSYSFPSRLRLRRFYGILKQHRDGHRPDPAGNGADPAGLLADRLEIHVADIISLQAFFIPTSMTTAPSFTMSAVTNLAFPIATNRSSASRQTAGRSFVFE